MLLRTKYNKYTIMLNGYITNDGGSTSWGIHEY